MDNLITNTLSTYQFSVKTSEVVTCRCLACYLQQCKLVSGIVIHIPLSIKAKVHRFRLLVKILQYWQQGCVGGIRISYDLIFGQ